MIYIRTDSNAIIASGHVMRCMAIAQALQERKVKIKFLTVEPSTQEMLQSKGFPCVRLAGRYDDFSLEIEQVKECLSKTEDNVLLIDSYSITESYCAALRPYAKIAYLGSAPQIMPSLDLLINYSNVIDRAHYQAYPSHTKLLLGTKYSPLRKEFSGIRPKPIHSVSRILITSGNSERANFTEKLLRCILQKEHLRGLQYTVILGKYFTNKAYLRSAFRQAKNIDFVENICNMAEIIQEHDIIISAAGSTLYEICACGRYAITYALVQEQVPGGIEFEKQGIFAYCGCVTDDVDAVVDRVVCRLQQDSSDVEKLNAKISRMTDYIDVNGMQRILDALQQLECKKQNEK